MKANTDELEKLMFEDGEDDDYADLSIYRKIWSCRQYLKNRIWLEYTVS